MEINKILSQITSVFLPKNPTITQLKHEEDDEFYQVWKIGTDEKTYLLKEAKEYESEIYQTVLAHIKGSAPFLYQVVKEHDKTYLLLEYIEGETLCKCNRVKLVNALNTLIDIQQKTWQRSSLDNLAYSFEKSLIARENRGKYLNDSQLENAYKKFLKVYANTPKTLCHDDLLPFNVISSKNKAVFIDWEIGGMLPYPTSFARLIAHVENDKNALFYMAEEDKTFAIDYYYENLLKDKGISYNQWLTTLEYFLFYEYCEWVFVGNKYNATDGEYYKKYLPIAKHQANKILDLK